MKIVVIGDGKVGRAIVEQVVKEGHTVVVIDKRPQIINDLVNTYDVMGIVGNGASYITQKNAGIGTANLVVSATSSDETNILSCLVAKKLGAKATIARVRDYDYSKQISLIQKDLGISMVINPELESATEIMNIINFPQAIRVDSFAKGNVDLVELYVPKDSPLIGQSLSEIHNKYQVKILICAVQRGEEVIIPTGSFVIHQGDKIHITASKSGIRSFLHKLDLVDNKLHNIMIVGGGKIALYLGSFLLRNKYNVKIIEIDKKRCEELSELLPAATIINGDGTNKSVLIEEGLLNCDAFISLTGSDEENIILSMYVHTLKNIKTITKVSKSSFGDIVEAIGGVSVIKPREITSSKVISYIRGRNTLRGNNLVTLYKLVNNKVEALEFNVKENSKIINTRLRDLHLKKNVLIACIIHDGDVIIPSGNDIIEVYDSVIVVTAEQIIDDLDDILE